MARKGWKEAGFVPWWNRVGAVIPPWSGGSVSLLLRKRTPFGRPFPRREGSRSPPEQASLRAAMDCRPVRERTARRGLVCGRWVGPVKAIGGVARRGAPAGCFSSGKDCNGKASKTEKRTKRFASPVRPEAAPRLPWAIRPITTSNSRQFEIFVVLYLGWGIHCHIRWVQPSCYRQ